MLSDRRQKLIAGNRQIIARAERQLREAAAAAPLIFPRTKVALEATYHLLDDGSAHHAQSSGWRMLTDVIIQKLTASAEAEARPEPQSREIQLKFLELEKRLLAYPFVAAWRLCIEIETKSAIETVVSVLPRGSLAGRPKKEMARTTSATCGTS
jgi:hypothetical protein